MKEIPREAWDRETIREAASPCSPENTISPDTDAIKALAMMNQSGVSRLLVVENGRLVGIVTLKDLLDFFSLKVELEEQRLRRPALQAVPSAAHEPEPQTKEFLFLLLAIVIGALAGVGTLGFLALIDVGQWGFWPGKAILWPGCWRPPGGSGS